MSFDILAPHYSWMEFILAGRKLHRCRTAFLDDLPPVQNILLLGEGHGRALVECSRRFGSTQMTCMDSSERMLAMARHHLTRHSPTSPHVQFLHADFLQWSAPPDAYDLIIANFFLDCFRADQLEQIAFRIANAATSQANVLLADFQVAPHGFFRIRSRLILWMMYRFFSVATRLPARRLSRPDSALQRAGFTLHQRRESEWGLLHSDWWRRY